MAYMNQERKAKIVAAVKPILKQYGVKGTFAVRHHSTIVLTLTEGDVDFIADYPAHVYSYGQDFETDYDHLRSRYHFNVRRNWLDLFPKESDSYKLLNAVLDAMQAADWFDNSDISTDYFHTAYYIDVNIGRWNKPYVYTGAAVEVAA